MQHRQLPGDVLAGWERLALRHCGLGRIAAWGLGSRILLLLTTCHQRTLPRGWPATFALTALTRTGFGLRHVQPTCSFLHPRGS
jgi:hypothetical protein